MIGFEAKALREVPAMLEMHSKCSKKGVGKDEILTLLVIYLFLACLLVSSRNQNFKKQALFLL